MLKFSSYLAENRDGCLDLFKSNVPKFFHENEITDFSEHLDKFSNENYWCMYDQEELVGAGGIHVRDDGVGRLCWGIIRRDLHRKGYGTKLLNFRLKKLVSNPSVKVIQLDTSQFNPGFFNRFDFKELKIIENVYGPGLHSHEMELQLNPEIRQKILRSNLD